jgi:hypothetical protein
LEFSKRCVQRLKQVFYSVGASSEKFDPSSEDLPGPSNISKMKLMTSTKS